jgi:hypothetical protein
MPAPWSTPEGDPPPPEPWSADADSWRERPVPSGATPCAGAIPLPQPGSWPQLAAAPLYWMWLEALERERARAA